MSQSSVNYDCTLDQVDLLDGEDLAKESACLVALALTAVSPFDSIIKQPEYDLIAIDDRLSQERHLIKPRSQSLATHLMGTSPPVA